MNNDNPLKKIKFVCFEGADMCGKTTSAIEFCKRVPLAIYVHFPRRERIDDENISKESQLEFFEHNLEPKDDYNAQRLSVHHQFKRMGETIFNDNWWKNISFLKADMNHIFDDIYHIIGENIEISANDKEIFLKNLIDIFKKGKYEFKDLPFTKDWRFFKGGKEVENLEDKISVFNQFINSLTSDDATLADKQYFVLDRFLLSGNVYNLELPMRKVKQELLKKAAEENVNTDIVYDYIKKIEKFHRDMQGSRNRGLLELLTEGDYTFNGGFEIPLNFLTVLCTPPEIDLSRPDKQDEYDKSTWLSKNVKDLMYGFHGNKEPHQKHMRYAWWFKGNYAGNRYCTKDDKYGSVLAGPNYSRQVPMIYSTIISGKSITIGNHPIYRWYLDPCVWEEDPYLYPLPTLFHRFKDFRNESEYELNKSFSIKGSEVTQGSVDDISEHISLEKNNYYEWLRNDICNYF